MCFFFLDMSKAFDTLSPRVLLKKLSLYGYRGKCHNLINSYLENRKLIVRYNGELSDYYDVKTGSPQGANLSPFLYILYTNCVCKELRYCSSVLFADDTSLQLSGKNIKCLIQKAKN